MVFERLKDRFIPTEKYEDTEECRMLRKITQLETNSQWKQLCEEIEEALEKYGVEEGKTQLLRGRGGKSLSGKGELADMLRP